MTSVLDVEAEKFDRRPSPRKRVLLPGLIVYGNDAFTCDCKFRNLSTTGARVSLAHLTPLPRRFYLINVSEGVAHRARLVWNKGLEMGVNYESALSLSAKPDIVFERLKKLWLAKLGRYSNDY